MIRRWLPVQLKRAFQNPAIWIVTALAVLAFGIVSSVMLHEPRGTSFGLYTDQGVCAASIKEYFENEKDTMLRCRIYSDRDKMQLDVMRGKIDCAFAVKEDLDEIVFEEREGEQGIIYYQTALTSNGLVLKEKVFSCVMQAKSEHILSEMAGDRKIFPTGDEKLADKLLKKQREYSRGDNLFKVVFLSAQGEELESGNIHTSAGPILPHKRVLLAGLLIFVAALTFAREKLTSGYGNIAAVLIGKEKAVYLLTRVFAQVLPIAAALLAEVVIISVIAEDTGGIAGVVNMAVSVMIGTVLSVLWSACFSVLFKSETAYLFGMVSVLAVSFLLTVSGAGETVPVLGMLGHLFPLGWM